MIETIEAEEAWWPPTFTPERFSRTLLAWWMIEVASHSTRRCTRSSVRSDAAASEAGEAIWVTTWHGTPPRSVATGILVSIVASQL